MPNKRRPRKKKTENYGRTFRYKVSRDAFERALASRTDGEKKMNPYVWYRDMVNREFNLMGTCVEVIVN